jgi:hypothetical protein
MNSVVHASQMYIRKSEGKRLLESPRHRWENNMKLNLKEMEWEVVVWIHWAQNRVQRQAVE